MKNLLTEWTALDYDPKQIKETTEADGKIRLSGIIQRADALNQNGRVYPKEILAREIRNYQKFIVENRAMGECVPPGTENYTQDGWKNIENIADDERIFTLNTERNEIQLQRISRKVDLPYAGKMYRFRNASSYDMLLTPDHKLVIWNRRGEPTKISAKDLYASYLTKDSTLSHSSLRRAGARWVGEKTEIMVIPGTSYTVDTKLWAAFLGIYLAEGHSSGAKKEENKRFSNVVLTQKDPHVQLAIENLLSKLPFEHKVKVRACGLTKDYVIHDSALHAHLVELGSSRQKYVPTYTKLWDADTQEILLEWMLMGDGRHRRNGSRGLIPEYCTTSQKLADDVAEIMFKIGHGGTIHVWDRSMDRPSPDEGRMILGENCEDMRIVYQHASKTMSLDFRFMQAEEVDYDGQVYCVTVANGTWLMRYNGRVCWTGNCDHPESSIINLKNVSHIMREVRMEGDDVIGALELLNTPSGKILQSLVESGVKLGISSRGVGSTKKEGDYNVVGDDFVLICFDVVAEPSTAQAFLHTEGRKIDDSDLRKVLRKSDRIDRILNDITSRRGDK